MAKVNIEEVIDHLDNEIRRALAETIKQHFPNINFNERDVFRTFKRMVGRRCSTWENIPDQFIEK